MLGGTWGRATYISRRASGFSPNVDVYYSGDPQRAVVKCDLAGIDHALAAELWADTAALDELAAVLPAGCAGTVDYEDDPFGVQYWVVRWEW